MADAVAITRHRLARGPINLAARTGDGAAVFDLDAKNGVQPSEMLQVLANVEIGMLILALYEAARAQEWRWRWFEALVAHHNDLAGFCEKAGKPKALPALRPPIDLDAPPSKETLAGRAPGVLKGLRDAVVAIADQAYATEEMLEEFSGELGGADPLRQEARQLLEATEERLGRLIEQLEVWMEPVERGDGDACLAELRGMVEAARRRG